MEGRMYTVQFNDVSVSAVQDLFEISPADDKPVEICGIQLSNTGGAADAGDAQEELLRLQIIRGFTSSGSSGSSPTPAPVDPGDAAAGFSAEVNNTTVANTGTSVTIMSTGINIRLPEALWFPPECRPKASQANTTIVVRLPDAPADAVKMSGTLWVREL
jgi:hypothetical protein